MNSLFAAAGAQSSPSASGWWLGLAVVGVLAVLVGTVWLIRRRRTPCVPSSSKRWNFICPEGGAHEFVPVVEAGEYFSRCLKCQHPSRFSFQELGPR